MSSDMYVDPHPFNATAGDDRFDVMYSVYFMSTGTLDVAAWINADRRAYWDWVDVEIQKPRWRDDSWCLPARYVKISGQDGISYSDECDLMSDQEIEVDVLNWTREKYDAMVAEYPWASVFAADRNPEPVDPGPQPTGDQGALWDGDEPEHVRPERVGSTVPKPTARATDPGTSHAAAKSVRHQTDTHNRILTVLEQGHKTDEQIYTTLTVWGTKVSPSGARTRRKELVDIGKIVKVGEKRGTTNRLMAVWGLANGTN